MADTRSPDQAPQPVPDTQVSAGIQPIETRYAGCRFRSRLEARWAVFFAHLKIRWQYEPQGFTLSTGDFYLPDFYLPELDQWVEVKGALNGHDFLRISIAAGELPAANKPNRIRHGVILLGEIPEPGTANAPVHMRITVLGDFVLHQMVAFTKADCIESIGEPRVVPMQQVIATIKTPTPAHQAISPNAMAARYHLMLPCMPEVADAHRAARSARFEHGEAG